MGVTNKPWDYVPGSHNPWWMRTVEGITDGTCRRKLLETIEANSTLKFDHVRVGHLGKRDLCVFVAMGGQSAVLYDRVKGFPSAKLMASLLLLGSK